MFIYLSCRSQVSVGYFYVFIYDVCVIRIRDEEDGTESDFNASADTHVHSRTHGHHRQAMMLEEDVAVNQAEGEQMVLDQGDLHDDFGDNADIEDDDGIVEMDEDEVEEAAEVLVAERGPQSSVFMMPHTRANRDRGAIRSSLFDRAQPMHHGQVMVFSDHASAVAHADSVAQRV